MSSNLSIKKICEFCKNEFTARTIKTRYCSHKCNSRHYKVLKKQGEIEIVEKATKLKLPSIEEVNKKDLTVNEVAVILNMSKRTVYRLIQNNELNSYNFSVRKTLIRRKDIDSYFELNMNNANLNKDHLKETITPENAYNITEIQQKYNISSGALYNIINRLDIQKKTFGKHILVKKEDIDKIFAS